MIIHFVFWTEAEPEGGVLEESLAPPGRYIKQADAIGANDAHTLLKHRQRIPQMFQNRDAQYDVQTGRGYPAEHVGQDSLDGSDFRFYFKVRCQRRIHQYGAFDLRNDRPDEVRLVSAAEISNLLPRKGIHVFSDLM